MRLFQSVCKTSPEYLESFQVFRSEVVNGDESAGIILHLITHFSFQRIGQDVDANAGKRRQQELPDLVAFLRRDVFSCRFGVKEVGPQSFNYYWSV